MLVDIFKYGPFGLCGIEASNGATGNLSVIFIPGLTEGFLQPHYVEGLAKNLGERNVRFFQPLLRSSYSGWGFSSLEQDARDLLLFIAEIRREKKVKDVALIGHSTGCQDIVQLLSEHTVDGVTAAILQAPVSDREALNVMCSTTPGLAEVRIRAVQAAQKIAVDEFLPREAERLVVSGHPLTAGRFLSLTGEQTSDDCFSSDLPENYLRSRFAKIHIPVFIIQGLRDEFIPKSVDPMELAERMASNFPHGSSVCIDADHSLKGKSCDLYLAVNRLLKI